MTVQAQATLCTRMKQVAFTTMYMLSILDKRFKKWSFSIHRLQQKHLDFPDGKPLRDDSHSYAHK